MIDPERPIYGAVAKAVRTAVSGAVCSPQKVSELANFPYFEFVMLGNVEETASRDLENNENVARIMFQADAYSNLARDAQTQCKAMLSACEAVLRPLGYFRSYMTPETPPAVSGVTRYTARYEGLISD